jgi:uncharacterized protein
MPKIRNKKMGVVPVFLRMLRYLQLRLLRLDEPPHIIARGMAIGLFIAFLPLVGFQMTICVLVAFFLRQNVIPLIIMVWVTNPVTFIPIYAFNYHIGKIILPYQNLPAFHLKWPIDWSAMISLGWEFFSTLWAGSILVGIVSASLIFVVSIPAIKSLHLKRRPPRRKTSSHYAG